MVVTDCEINVQSYIPYCAPVAHRVPKSTPICPAILMRTLP